MPAVTDNHVTVLERRLRARKKIRSTIYVDLEKDNGGILLDLSETGMSVQAAFPLFEDRVAELRFRFSPAESYIHTSGTIVWKDESKKVLGIEFTGLSAEARRQIGAWIAAASDETPQPTVIPRKPLGPPADGAQTKPSSDLLSASPEAPSATSSREPAAAAELSLPTASLDEAESEPAATEPANAPMVDGAAPTAIPSLSVSDVQDRPIETHPGLLSEPELPPAARVSDAAPHTGSAAPPPKARRIFSVPVSPPISPSPPERQRKQRPSRQREITESLLKTYIVDDRFRIRLHDLVSGKAAELCRQLDTPNFPTDVAVSAADVIERVHRYEQLTSEALLPIMILGCFWGHQLQDSIWSKLLEWVANARTTEGHDTWLSLQLYPALLLLYGGGVAAMSAEKYSAVAQLLLKPRLSETDNVSKLILKLNAPMVVEDESLAYQLLGEAQWHAPMSFYLCKLLREYFREYLPSDAHYCEVFDRFEYLLSLVWADENPLSAAWAPLGCFAWERISAFDRAERCMDRVDREITELGQNWPLLRVGFFSGSYERLLSARRRVANFVNSQR